MVDRAITDLPTELVAVDVDGNDDWLEIDDVSAGITKKVHPDSIVAGGVAGALTSVAPANVTKAAAAVGTGTKAARDDHKHDIATASAQAITGRVNAEGTSSQLARADHTHQINPATVVVSTSPHTLAATTGVLVVDTTTGQINVNLPNPGTVSGLLPLLIIDRENTFATNKCNLVRFGAEEIDNVAATKALDKSGGRWHLWTDGTNWYTAECPPISYDTPVNVTKAAAVAGASQLLSRADHKHDVTTASAQAIPGRSNTEGTSSALARADHTHAIAPSTQILSADGSLLADVGVLLVDTTAALVKVLLPNPATVTALLPVLIIDRENTAHTNAIQLDRFGTEEIDNVAASKVLDLRGGRWWLWTDGANWYTAECAPTDFAAPVNVTKAAAAEGTSSLLARADHKHDVTTAAPVAVGRANAEGSSSSLARADHVHDAPIAIVEKTAAFSLASTDDYIRITSGSAVTVTLPNPATVGARRWRILLSHDTAGDVTLDRFGAETIQGVAADYVLTGAWTRYEFVCDGTNWWLF